MSEEKKPLSREDRLWKMREFNDRIAYAQSVGDNMTANQIYQDQQRWISSVDGNRPIVGGRDPNSPHGSRGA